MSFRPRSRCPLSRKPLAPLYAHFAPARSRVPPIPVPSCSHPSLEPGKSRSLSHIPGHVFLDPSPYSQSQFLVPSSRSCSRSQSHMPAPIPGPCPVFSVSFRSLSPVLVLVPIPSLHFRSLYPFPLPVPSHRTPPPPSLRPPAPSRDRGNPALLPPTNHSARSLLYLHNHALCFDPPQRRLQSIPGPVCS